MIAGILSEPLAQVYLVGQFVACVLVGLFLLAVLAQPKDPDRPTTPALLVGGLLAVLAWPLVIAAAVGGFLWVGVRDIVRWMRPGVPFPVPSIPTADELAATYGMIHVDIVRRDVVALLDRHATRSPGMAWSVGIKLGLDGGVDADLVPVPGFRREPS